MLARLKGVGASIATRGLALEVVGLVLTVLVLATWFACWPGWLHPAVPVVLLLGGLGWRLRGSWRSLLHWPRPETLLCLALAGLYRLPALLHPWGWVNKDGAYGAFVAHHLLEGTRPGPVFTEGANYQGTLKAHLAALLGWLTPATDLSFLMVAASVSFSLVFLVASMGLARRLAGPTAALVTGLYLALGPKFLTTFSINCVGQYVEVLALGGMALLVIAGTLEGNRGSPVVRYRLLLGGMLLGAALWHQPVALCYLATAGLALALRRQSWRDPWSLSLVAGLGLGLLPVLLWNLENEWATREILGQNVGGLGEMLLALPEQIQRTFSLSLPILAGLSRGHPWTGMPGLASLVALLPLALLLAYLALRRREILDALRGRGHAAALLPPLLMLTCLAMFWSVPAERIHLRPRYLLPVMAATAVHLGVVAEWAWQRWRIAVVGVVGGLLLLNLVGMLPRLAAGPGIASEYRILVRSLERKPIATGYADFSISAPVTMFTAERIVLSPRLGPTPAYVSEAHSHRVEQQGPDAYVLRRGDDPQRFATVLDQLGVSYRLDLEPVPVFYDFSRRVRLEEVWGFRDPGWLPPVAGDGSDQ